MEIPAFSGVQGPGDMTRAEGLHGLNPVNVYLIVSKDPYLLIHGRQDLYQIIGKGVVVIYKRIIFFHLSMIDHL